MTQTDWRSRYSTLAQRTAPPEISWLMAQALEVPGLISLAAGFVDQESLPGGIVSAELGRLFGRPETGRAALQYGTTQGDLELRETLIEKLRGEGVLHPGAGIDASQSLVGSGSQQILYLACETLLDSGDIVLVEAPTYFVMLGPLGSRGVRTVGIDTDEDGVIPERVEEALDRLDRDGELHRVKMLYLMTYATNPLGVTLTEERRTRLLSILRSCRERGHPILLLEDAAYRRLCFEPPPSPIKSYDEENDLVLYTESFSKSFSPGLRLGFGVGPKAIIEKMVDIKGGHDFGSTNLNQQVLKSIIQSGGFDEHVTDLLGVYKRKRNVLLDVLEENLPDAASCLRPGGGLYAWVTLPPEYDTGPSSQVFTNALAQKVLYVPGCLGYSPDRPESKRSTNLRLTYGMLDEDHLRIGGERLGQALRLSMDA